MNYIKNIKKYIEIYLLLNIEFLLINFGLLLINLNSKKNMTFANGTKGMEKKSLWIKSNFKIRGNEISTS